MLVLSLRRNGFRRIESLLSLPNMALIVQRIVHWQTRKSSVLSEFNLLNAESDGEADSLSRFPIPSPKRVDSLWKVGAQVSGAGGMENAVTNAVSIGANSFALYLKSPIQWKSPSLTPKSISEFKKRMKQYGYANNMVLSCSSRLIHIGNPVSNTREKSYECFLDDLQRCEALGLELYNFRPGSTFGKSIESSITLIAESINWAHKATGTVTIVLKNMEGAKKVIGSKFSELAGIIDKVKDKTRIGVCLDTACAFAAGYDIRTKEGWDATMSEFDKEIGLNYLRGMVLSDSKTNCNSRKDQRQNIGLGHVGITAFQHILQDPRTRNIPLILATPSFKRPKVVWGKEIEVLQALTSTPTIRSEDLQSLVHEITSAVEEAQTSESRKKKLDGDSVVGELAESIKTRRQNKPEPAAERESPSEIRRRLWQKYLI